MEIVVVGLIFALGAGLLVGPRVARRRRGAPVNVSGWTGATASTRRRAALATGRSVPTAGAVDDDLWDDDLGWVDPPSHASAGDAGLAPPRTRGAEPRAGEGTRTPAAAASIPTRAGNAATRAAATVASVPSPVGNPPPAPLPTPSGFRFTPVPEGGRLALKARRAGEPAPLAPESLVAAPGEPAPLAPDSLVAAPVEPAPLAPDSLVAAPIEPKPAEPAPLAPTLTAPASDPSGQADTATPAAWSDPEADWSTGVEVPPPRIARGAAAFGAGVSPSASGRGTRRSFVGRHPVLLVAAYATAGIALVVLGASYVSSDSFRSSGASAGQRTADVTPTATVARTPARTPAPTPTPARRPDAAKLAAAKAASRARTAWLHDRRTAAQAEERAVARARSKARAKARQKAAARRRRRPPASPPSRPATVASPPAPTPAPAPVHRSPPPCEFCIG